MSNHGKRERTKVEEVTELKLCIGRPLTGTRSGMEKGPEARAKFLMNSECVYVCGGE